MSTTEGAERGRLEPGAPCPNCGFGDPLRVPDGEEDGMEIQIGDGFYYEESDCPECGMRPTLARE